MYCRLCAHVYTKIEFVLCLTHCVSTEQNVQTCAPMLRVASMLTCVTTCHALVYECVVYISSLCTQGRAKTPDVLITIMNPKHTGLTEVAFV